MAPRLVDLNTVKPWCGVTGNADDDLLTSLIVRTETAVESYCNTAFTSKSLTFTRNGSGRSVMTFPNGPVTAVASVSVDDVVIPRRPMAKGAGWSFDEDYLYLSGYCFTRGTQNVVVSNTGGYSTVPADITQAVIDIVAHKYASRGRIGLASKVLNSETVSFLRDVPPDVMRTLQNYMRVAPLL